MSQKRRNDGDAYPPRARRGSNMVLKLPDHNEHTCIDCQREELRRLRAKLSDMRQLHKNLTNDIELIDAARDAATFQNFEDDDSEDQ